MKKLLIVNNNMKVGGVQKSLYNLLWEVSDRYDITLFLFGACGEYIDKLPENVKIIECKSLFRYLGVSQSECSSKRFDRIKRGILAGLCRVFGRPFVMRILLASQKKLPERYDCAISFLHNGRREAFYAGTQDFVLHRTNADKKIAFLHCDYRNSGSNHKENNRQLSRFDVIAACSEGCRDSFITTLPELAEKCMVVRNFNRFDEIKKLAGLDPVRYDKSKINVVMVSRLSHEKGIERAIEAVADSIKRGSDIALHIVGGGSMEAKLRLIADSFGVADSVFFHGEQGNPYRFMVDADLFLLSSYHEAAPLVIDEAECLGLPVLTVRTTSSDEMVLKSNFGWVCENDADSLCRKLFEIVSNKEELRDFKKVLKCRSSDNSIPARQFGALVDAPFRVTE